MFKSVRGLVVVAALGLAVLGGVVLAARNEARAAGSAASTPVAGKEMASGGTAPVCRIGKPSYCLKYGGSRCEASNTAPDVKAACAAWTRGCFECHEVGNACREGRGFRSGDIGCAACQEVFVQCLYRMDAKFWPNRMSKRT